MDEPRFGRRARRLAILVAMPVAAVALWVSVAAAGGSGSQQEPRSDSAKPAQLQKTKSDPTSRHDGRKCPFRDAATSADV